MGAPTHSSSDFPSSDFSSNSVVQITPSPGGPAWGGWQEQSFSIKLPSLPDLAVFANRLLKFKFPVFRNLQAYERLLNRQLQAPKLSKKALESLPMLVLEILHQQIWRQALPPSNPTQDFLLTATLLVEEMMQYRTSEWLCQDIQLLGLQERGPLHSYYFSPQAAPETYRAVLAEYGYRTDFLPAGFELGYLACRAFTTPLPWSALLENLSADSLKAFPRLHRLEKIHRFYLDEGLYAQWNVVPDTLEALCQHIRLLEQGTFLQFSRDLQAACPVRQLVLVEGATEELLLPIFAKSMGVDIFQEGIFIQAAGGKNQVPALYHQAAELLNIPIFIVLDRDAEAIYQELHPGLRPQDILFLLQEGEIEDMYDLDLMLKTINEHYHPHPKVTREAFLPLSPEDPPLRRVEVLKSLWKTFQLGDFDKTDFAEKLSHSFTPPFQLPASLRQLIEAIVENRHAALVSDV